MSNQMGVIIVGCGYWGVNYIRNFTELHRSRVVGLCDRSADRLTELGRRFPESILTTNLDEALQLPDVDAAVICTNATSHYDVARRCLQAGKHVLIEKPMATTTPNAQDLINLAARKDVVLMVGHIFLYNAGIRKIKSCFFAQIRCHNRKSSEGAHDHDPVAAHRGQVKCLGY